VINFAIYLISFVTSVAVIFTAPDQYLKGYLASYTLFSVIFSLSFFVYFRNYASPKSSKIVLSILIVAFIILSFAASRYYSSLIFYPGMLIFTDLAATQSLEAKNVNKFRFLLILTTIHFIIWPNNFQINLILRVYLLFVVSIFIVLHARHMHKIEVQSPWKFMAGNYIFYNGILLTITYSGLSGEYLRYWFLSAQAGLVFILKYLDFSLRKSYSATKFIRNSVYACSALAPLPVFGLLPVWNVIFLYYVGMIGLIFTSRYIHE
jgi:hypothetical protein